MKGCDLQIIMQSVMALPEIAVTVARMICSTFSIVLN